MLLLFLRDSWPPCEVAFINIIELPWENISCLRFLPNRNIFYDTRSSHKQKHVFVLVSIGRKVPLKARSVRGPILAVIRLIAESQVLSSV